MPNLKLCGQYARAHARFVELLKGGEEIMKALAEFNRLTDQFHAEQKAEVEGQIAELEKLVREIHES